MVAVAVGTGNDPAIPAYEVKRGKRGRVQLRKGHVTASPNNKVHHRPSQGIEVLRY
jgi:hypothetical protein